MAKFHQVGLELIPQTCCRRVIKHVKIYVEGTGRIHLKEKNGTDRRATIIPYGSRSH